MEIQFIDLAAQYRALKQDVDARIAKVLEHGRYIMGPEVREMEQALEARTGAPHCISVASGTEALLIALMAIGVSAGDEVITTSFTFVATAEVIALLGAVPVFVDVEPDTCNIDANLIEAAITPRTKAIIPVSLYGQVADMDAINAIAARHPGITVIEDAAQSFGATYRGKASCNVSRIACTSFFPSKPLGCYGDGQMNPLDMPAILAPVINDVADYSKGNRLVTGEAFKRIPKIRFFGNSALSLLTKIASGYWGVADSQTGYTAINAKALAAIDWDHMYKRYGQPNDLLVRLNIAEMRVVDVPVEPVYNVGEKSGIRVRKVLFSIGWLIVRLFFYRLKEKYIIRDFHPLVFFYAFGGATALVGLLFLVRTILLWFTQGSMPEMSFLVTLFSFSISFNAIGFAFWFDYQANRHLNPPITHRDVTHRQAPDPIDP
ncbi:aminotransferase class I/II-fold pyridoxal phosphate-dependent enzyme [Streptomyces niveus]